MTRRLLAFPAWSALTLSAALERRLRRGGHCPLTWRRWARLWCREQARRMNRDFRTDLYQADPEMLWRMRPGASHRGMRVNRLGLLGDEPLESPPEGGRWLFLTSSGAAHGPRPYPHLLGDVLRAGGMDIEILNGGMHGATCEQGLALARRLLPTLRPTVVFISYLWNDHWRSSVATDEDMMALLRDDSAFARGSDQSSSARMVRSLRRFAVRAHRTPPRVPGRRHAENHRALVALIREHGARPVFLDLPGNQARAVHPGYLRRGFASTVAEFQRGHARFAERVRELAKDLSVDHIDLEPDFAAHSDRDRLFERDHLHWSPRGVNHAVRSLVSRLAGAGVITPEAAERSLAQWRPTSLCPDDMRAELRVEPLPAQATAGSEIEITAHLENTGNTVWLARTEGALGQVRLAVQCWPEGGEPDAPPLIDAREDLPHDLAPGESVTVQHRLSLPWTPGPHRLRIDAVSELVTFFHSHAGTEPLEHRLTLTGI
ncbi:SGNH/GDSL hydrolase family protein [Candidatus Sumerlaeota bacterium]|nr:SGNH/GDSL hydrolase family protein [Candidatus Sumerlaeota bacterium]